MINVVQITENPIAGAPINLSSALNQWSRGEVRSRHIAASDRNENRVFNADLLISPQSYQEIRRVLKDADVIHFHNFYRNQKLFRDHPELWDLVSRKPQVWQAHTQRDIAWMSMEDGLRSPLVKERLVIAQYHPRMYPECVVVQNVVDIFDPDLTPAAKNVATLPRIVYSPSRIRLKGWDDKGYDCTAPVLQKLVNEGLAAAEIIYDKPHRTCLSRKRIGDIGVDEVVTGSYHLCSLETLSQGLATIAGLDELQVKTLVEATGSPREKLPWVKAYRENLESVLRDLLSDRTRLAEIQFDSRAWMLAYWHPEKVISRYVEAYQRALR